MDPMMSNPEQRTAKKSARNVLVVEDDDTDFLLVQRKLVKLLKPTILDRAKNRSELSAALLVARDLIVADYHLPDVEEHELITAIHTAQPATPCLILSGSTAHIDPRDAQIDLMGVIGKGDVITLEKILRDYFYVTMSPEK